jgi:hypothetical protein
MCTAVLIGWGPNTPPPPHFGLIYARALLVSQDRRHLFVTPVTQWLSFVIIRDLKATSAFYTSSTLPHLRLTEKIVLSAKLKETVLMARMALIILISIFIKYCPKESADLVFNNTVRYLKSPPRGGFRNKYSYKAP